MCKVSGYSKGELLGARSSIFRDPKNSPEIFEDLWNHLKNGEEYSIDRLSNKRKDGSIYYLKVRFTIRRNHKDEIVGYRSFAHDVTETTQINIENELLNANYLSIKHTNEILQKNIEQKEQSMQMFKSNFISLFTHELKTPLNSIINFSDYIVRLIEKGNLNETKIAKIAEVAKKIHLNGLNQETMINNLLEFSKIESGRLEVHKKYFSLKELVVKHIAASKELYNKTVECDIPDDLEIYADPKICEMIFGNLFSNGLKYSKSHVKISAFSQENDLIWIIEDDGAGIHGEDKIKVFEMFTQTGGESVLKMEKKGTGIGLYTVKLLVDICGKEIKLENSKELGGAKFIIRGVKNG